MSDPHLNLFHSYDNARIEDNVTRALIVTLSQLSPVHQRLLFSDLFLANAPSGREKSDVALLRREPLTFDLQVQSGREESEGEDRLTAETGVLVGLHHASTEADIDSEALRQRDGAARVDAYIEDPSNDLTAVIEVKLGSSFDRSQLATHHARFFEGEAHFDEVFCDVSWTDLVGYLDELRKQTVSSREEYVLAEFVGYANMIGLAPFLGFEATDFQEEDLQTLQRFVTALERTVQTRPPLVPHGNAKRLDFDGIDPNLWVDYRNGSLELGLVCGVEKRQYSRQYRRVFVEETEDVRQVFNELAQQAANVDDQIDLVLHPRARFFGTRVQVRTSRAGQTYSLPEELSAVRDLFADDRLNPHERISRKEITERFGQWLDDRDDSFGPDGYFMPWPELDEKGVLTTMYCHTGYQIPRDELIGRDRDYTLEYVEPLVQALASAAESLAELRKT